MEPQELTGQVRRIVAFSWAIAIGAKPIFIDLSRLGAVLEGGHNSEARFAGERNVPGSEAEDVRCPYHPWSWSDPNQVYDESNSRSTSRYLVVVARFLSFRRLGDGPLHHFLCRLLSVPAGCDDLFRPDALRQKRSVPR